MVAPWVLKLLGLSIVFYAGIYMNVTLFLKLSIPAVINVFIIVFLIVLIVTQLILYHVKFGKYKYLFYTNRIEADIKKPATFVFSDFSQAELKQGLFDKFFNTGSVRLSKDFVIGPVSNVAQIKNYVEQLIKYYNFTQQRYKTQQQNAQMQQSVGTPQAAAQAGVATGVQ